MFIYILLIAIEFFLYFVICINSSKKKAASISLFIGFVLMFIISALRAETVGGDLTRYLPEFDYIAKDSFKNILLNGYQDRERGYALLESCISCISNSHRFYLAVISAIIYALGYHSIKTFSVDRFLSLVIFTCLLFPSSLNILRASIVIVIGLNMLKYVIKRDFKHFLIWQVVAFFIQHTSIMLLPLYLLWKLEYRRNMLLIIMITSLALSLMISGISVLDSLVNYFNYTMSEESENYWSEKSAGLTNLAYFLTGITLFMMWMRKRMKGDILYDFYLHLMVIATCVQYFSSIFSLVTRLGAFYYAYLIFVIPYLFTHFPFRNKYLYKTLFVAVFIILYVIGLVKDGHSITPYKFL